MQNPTLKAVIGLDKSILYGFTLFTLTLMNGCNEVTPTGPPEAKAGPDTRAWAGKQFTLDASSSQPFSPGDSLAFKWSMLEKPFMSVAEIVEPLGKVASFTPDWEGRYLVQLQVDGPGNFSSMDTVDITAVTCMAAEISVSEYALLYDEDFNSLPSTHWQFTTTEWDTYTLPKVYAEDGSLVLNSGSDNNATFAKAELDLTPFDLATKDAVVIKMEITQLEFPFFPPPAPNAGGLSRASGITLQVLGKQITLRPVNKSIKNGQYITDRPVRLSNTVVTMRITASEFLTGVENPWCTNLEVAFNAQPMGAAKLSLEANSGFNDIGIDFPSEFRMGRIQIWAH